MGDSAVAGDRKGRAARKAPAVPRRKPQRASYPIPEIGSGRVSLAEHGNAAIPLSDSFPPSGSPC